MRQQLGSWEVDIPTARENADALKEALGHDMAARTAERYRGVKAIKLPVLTGTAAGTSLTLPTSGGQIPVPCGPNEGYFWRIGRVTVSSSATDAGAISLFAGSDPGNTSSQFLVDNTLKVGQAYYPGKWGLLLFPGEVLYAVVTSVSGNTYRLTGVATEVPAEMVGKLLS